jgi:hypothetical protein
VLCAFALAQCSDSSDHGSLADAATHADAGNSGAQADSGEPDGSVEDQSADTFWSAFQLIGEWAEYFPDLRALVANADLAAFGSIVDVERGKVWSEPGYSYAELVLTFEPELILSGEHPTGRVKISMVSVIEGTADELVLLKDTLPRTHVLAALRRREREQDYRIVNGYGIWARTSRAPIDCPIELLDENCAAFASTAMHKSVEELARSFIKKAR